MNREQHLQEIGGLDTENYDRTNIIEFIK